MKARWVVVGGGAVAIALTLSLTCSREDPRFKALRERAEADNRAFKRENDERYRAAKASAEQRARAQTPASRAAMLGSAGGWRELRFGMTESEVNAALARMDTNWKTRPDEGNWAEESAVVSVMEVYQGNTIQKIRCSFWGPSMPFPEDAGTLDSISLEFMSLGNKFGSLYDSIVSELGPPVSLPRPELDGVHGLVFVPQWYSNSKRTLITLDAIREATSDPRDKLSYKVRELRFQDARHSEALLGILRAAEAAQRARGSEAR